jgi:hypothetical protein
VCRYPERVTDTPSPETGFSRVPRSIALAAALILAEAGVLVALAVAELVTLDAGRVGLGLTNAVFFTLYALGLGFCARGLLKLSRWTRSPIVMTQIIQLGVAWSFYGHDTVWLTAILGVVAVAVLAIMLAPTTTTLLFGERRWYEPDEPDYPEDRDN